VVVVTAKHIEGLLETMLSSSVMCLPVCRIVKMSVGQNVSRSTKKEPNKFNPQSEVNNFVIS